MFKKSNLFYRDIFSVIGGIAIAAALVFSSGMSSWDNLAFRLGFFDSKDKRQEVIDTVEFFNKLYVGFFSSGGNLDGLNIFPTGDRLKRRIVQDINSWSADDKILSHDKQAIDIKSVEFISPSRVIVTSHEIWGFIVRSKSKGYKIAAPKVAPTKYRYILFQTGDGWKIIDFEAYGPDDTIPSISDIWLR